MSANGYLLDSELTIVQGSGQNAIRLNLPTAAILRRMQADAREDGVTITLVSSYRGAAGYRSRSTQLDMRARPGLYDITPGIIPGLPSGHGNGDCMDIDHGLAWVKANGARFGVTFPLAFDHNHARYDGITLAGIGTPITEEDDMTPAQAQMLEAVNERTRQIEAAVIGKIDGATVGLDPNVNFGQPLLYGQQQARIGVQTLLDRGVDELAAAIIAKLPSGGPTAEQITAAVKAAMPTTVTSTLS